MASGSRREARRTVTALALDAGAYDDAVDPEADAAQRAALHAAVVEVVAAHGGSVRAIEDRQALALFGAPTLHEDDAARATRAASAIRDRLPAAGLRIGLATGEVLLALGPDSSVEVAGPVAGSARRLTSTAEPGEILIDDRTATLVRDVVELEPAGAGRSVLRGPGGGHRLGRIDRPLVGRRRELRQLKDALDAAREERRCRLFTLVGPPGIGKSRLVDAFVAWARDDGGARVVRGHCLAYGDQLGVLALRELVLDGIDASDADGPPAILTALLEAFAEDRRASALADHVAVAVGASDGASAAEEGAWAVRLLFERLARKRPLVVVVDDIHWAPRSLLTLLETMVDASRGAPILLLCITRPELLEAYPTWGGGKVNATSLLLSPLPDHDVAAIVSNLLVGAAPGADVADAVSTRAEGNPLFVEEYVRALVDSGGLRLEPDGWHVGGPGAETAIAPPNSIMALLAARIESLPASERELCQRAAVVGRAFDVPAVMALFPATGRNNVDASIGSLVGRELLEPDPDDDQRFRFRHVLIRDAAYGALLIRDRIRLHEAHADWLGAAPEVADDLIGIHLEHAYRYRVELGDRSDATRDVADGPASGSRTPGVGRRPGETWRSRVTCSTVRCACYRTKSRIRHGSSSNSPRSASREASSISHRRRYDRSSSGSRPRAEP